MAATNTNTSVPATNATTTAAPVAVPGAPQTFQSASLYVGDLHPETDEVTIYYSLLIMLNDYITSSFFTNTLFIQFFSFIHS
jgi:hypothetical protein